MKLCVQGTIRSSQGSSSETKVTVQESMREMKERMIMMQEMVESNYRMLMHTQKLVERLMGVVENIQSEKEKCKISEETNDESELEKQVKHLMNEVRVLKEAQFCEETGRYEVGSSSKSHTLEKFNWLSLTKYDGNDDPFAHLSNYLDEVGVFDIDDELRVRLFQKSLTGAAFNWYVRLDSWKIKKLG